MEVSRLDRGGTGSDFAEGAGAVWLDGYPWSRDETAFVGVDSLAKHVREFRTW